MNISLRENLMLLSAALIALGTWFIKERIQIDDLNLIQKLEPIENRFYSKSTKIINTDTSGMHLFTLDADFAEQESNEIIKFYNVIISYSPESKIRWILKSDSAIKKRSDKFFILQGNVNASNVKEISQSSIIRTNQLEVDPINYMVKTDEIVNITIDNNTLSARGMLAILNENKLELISEINGSFLKQNVH